jgi:predicted ATP-dependent endonuclease of OLD family
MRAVILVEGLSDRLALEAVAARRGRDLDDERVSVVAMDGARNIGRFLERFGPRGQGIAMAGLFDAEEEPIVSRALRQAGSDRRHLAPTWNGSDSSPAWRTSRTS